MYVISGGRVVHIEIQQRPDPEMPRRMLEYAVRLFAAHPAAMTDGGLIQIVVQVSGRPMSDRVCTDVVDYRFRLLHVPSVPSQVLLGDPGLAPFAAARGEPGLAGAILTAITTQAEPQEQASLLTLALHLDTAGTLSEYLRRNGMTDVVETVIARLRGTEVAREFISEGVEQGIGRGITVAVTDILGARFPDGSVEQVARTAARLVAEHGSHAARAALTMDALDS